MANLVPTSKPVPLIPLVAFITMFLMLLNRVNSADSLSFTFNEFPADQEDLILLGDATTGSGNKSVLQLTKLDSSGEPVKTSVGRALYYAPVLLWKTSQLVSSFVTTFTFSISSPDTVPGDGLAFFIASPLTASTIPPNSAGRYLGLFSGPTSLKNSSNEKITVDVKDESDDVVIAVEFDTYPNTDIGDPDYQHIGIDINSIKSETTVAWDWKNGLTATAQISYDSASKRLTVVTSYPGTSPLTLSYDVDLFSILPQWVKVGFSASTGQQKQTNTILSWSFSSSLHANQIQEEDMYSIV